MSVVPAVVLGGTGYVAGELLRLIALHPQLTLGAVMSDSAPGEPVAGAFPHLQPAYPEERFHSESEVQKLLREAPQAALFSAAPHGVSAALIDRRLAGAEQAGTAPRVVDISADFRYASAAAYTEVYRHPHGAPGRLAQFSCALPEHLPRLTTRHVGHPGCFATAVLLASVPLLAAGLVHATLFVSGVTGSTGSGRKPAEGTHHPRRHGDLYSYGALTHRHVPEITARARHPCDAAGAAAPSARYRRSARDVARVLWRRALRAGERAGATRQGCRSEQLRASFRRGARQHRRGAVCHRQPHQGRGRRRHPVDEPHAGLRGNHRPHLASARLDLTGGPARAARPGCQCLYPCG